MRDAISRLEFKYHYVSRQRRNCNAELVRITQEERRIISDELYFPVSSSTLLLERIFLCVCFESYETREKKTYTIY